MTDEAFAPQPVVGSTQMQRLLDSIQIQEIDLETKEHGNIPNILLRAGFRLVCEIQVSKSEIHLQRANMMDHAKRELVHRLWHKMYGDLAKHLPALRHEVFYRIGPPADWKAINEAFDEFAKLFKRPL